MPPSTDLPFRQVHLDFHTGPGIPDVGADFDAREFARVMKAAHVNSVNVFAKCHHGLLYYNTARPERHPGLKPGLDLLREQVEALHREGIRAPIYISILCDEYAADAHPEWVAREADGRPVGFAHGLFQPGKWSNWWRILDMASPFQEFVVEQTREVLEMFKPVDGIWFDMCWDQPSCSSYALAAMLKENLNPELEADRAFFARRLARSWTRRLHDMVMASSPAADLYFNLRPIEELAEEAKVQRQLEIECLPTGGWGYMFFPQAVRWTRQFDRQYVGMTARFHRSWGDFGSVKPAAALEYETSMMMAHGAKCSIGDQMHPRGVLDGPGYELIGQVYARVAEREPWLTQARPVVEVAVLHPRGPLSTGGPGAPGSAGVEGATRVLTQLRHQFDIIGSNQPLEGYALVILPDDVAVDAALAAKLSAYLRGGGALLASGMSGLNTDATAAVLPELGIVAAGMSPFTATYLRPAAEIAEGFPALDHILYERGPRVTLLLSTSPIPNPTSHISSAPHSLAGIVEPYFERGWRHFSSHRQAPPQHLSPYAGVVEHGRCIYVAPPIFSLFANHGSQPYRTLIANLLQRLLPEPLIRVQAPLSAEAAITRRPGQTIVHLLYYPAERRTRDLDLIEEIIPIYGVNVSLKLGQEPAKVYTAPDRTELPFEYRDGRAQLRLPELRGHAMVVFESA